MFEECVKVERGIAWAGSLMATKYWINLSFAARTLLMPWRFYRTMQTTDILITHHLLPITSY